MNVSAPILVAIVLAALAIGALAGYLLIRRATQKRIDQGSRQAEQIVQRAERESKNLVKEAEIEAKEKLFSMQAEFDRQTKERRDELAVLEKRSLKREEDIDRKLGLLEQQTKEQERMRSKLEARVAEIETKESEVEKLVGEQRATLERLAGMSSDEAKRVLMSQMEESAKREGAARIKKVVDEARDTAVRKAQEIMGTAIQRQASDYVGETTVTVVELPNEEMKGRIIGREGRNIRALESATGIDLIIDDTPEAVILSGFDAIRREVAGTALLKLIADGRINPARIEEVVKKASKEMDQSLKETGEAAVFDTGIAKVRPEIVRLLGRLRYRTSYAQNVLQHSREVAFIAGIMADELGVNGKLARRAGLLHDLGKALDHEMEGSHAKIGADFARKHNESPDVVNAIEAHHGDVPPATIEAVLVMAADALSAARPGARREILETYIKRLRRLESIASEFEGVERAYAIQAGRELRIVVHPENIRDPDMLVLAREIADRVEQELEYPGEIRVTLIREKRAVEYAR